MIILTRSTRLSVELRIWNLRDAEFIVKCRNNPALQRWFKQDRDLTVAEQHNFMSRIAPATGYYGFIVEVGKTPIGFTCLRLETQTEAEFGIGILPQYQGKGYTLEAVNRTLSIGFNEFKLKRIFGDVFVHNPALSFYLWKCGFKAVGVAQSKYTKKMDVVLMEQRK